MVQADFDPYQYIDRMGALNFGSISQFLRQDRDWVNLTFGRERVGKTTLSHIICAIVDPNYDTRRIVFPTAELRWAIARSKPYQAINQDEGAETWLSTDASTAETRKMVRSFMQIGAKNLFVNVNIPDAGMINRYMKSHRAASVIRVTKRGQYAFYSAKRAAAIRKDNNTKVVIWPKPNFTGRFRKLPDSSEFIREYHRKEHDHKFSVRSENPKIIEKELQMERLIKNTVDFASACKQIHVTKGVLFAMVRDGRFKRAGIKPFRGPHGWRLTQPDMRKLLLLKWGKTIDKHLKKEGGDID